MKKGIFSFLLSIAFLPIFTQNSYSGELIVRRITFKNNEAFSGRELRGLMELRRPVFFSRPFWEPEVFYNDLENIRDHYVAQGYLEIEIISADFDTVGNRFLDIGITIYEGKRTFIDEIRFEGNEVIADDILLDAVLLDEGDPLMRAMLQESMFSMLSIYGERGYLAAFIDPRIMVEPETNLASVTFEINEGMRFYVSNIRLEGLERTRPSVVFREIPLEPGDVLDYSRVIESERNLFATGLFDSVFVFPEPAPPEITVRSIFVTLHERDVNLWSTGGGYGSLEGFEGNASFHRNNLFGTGRRIGFDGFINQLGYNARISYMQPWTFGMRIRTDMGGFIEYRENPAFDIRTRGFNGSLNRTIRPFTTSSIFTRLHRIEIDNIVGEVPTETESGTLRALGGNLFYDTRTDLFDPREGVYLGLTSEFTGFLLGGTYNFITLNSQASFYRPAGPAILAYSLLTGVKRPFNGSTIPVNERFFSGGPYLMRAWDYQELGTPPEGGEEPGGRLLLAGIAEMRFDLLDFLGLVFFLEGGNVWAGSGDFSLGTIRYGAGLGPRILTPFGILRLDFAFKLDRDPGETLNRFWLAFGQIF